MQAHFNFFIIGLQCKLYTTEYYQNPKMTHTATVPKAHNFNQVSYFIENVPNFEEISLNILLFCMSAAAKVSQNMPLTLWSFAAPSKHPADEGVGWQEGVQVHHHHLQPHQIHHHHLSPSLSSNFIMISYLFDKSAGFQKKFFLLTMSYRRRPLYNDTSYVRALGDVQKWAYFYYYCYDGMFQCASWFSSNIFQLLIYINMCLSD